MGEAAVSADAIALTVEHCSYLCELRLTGAFLYLFFDEPSVGMSNKVEDGQHALFLFLEYRFVTTRKKVDRNVKRTG